MSGYKLVTETDHHIEPVPASWYSVQTQHPASLLNHFDYPIEAVCLVCSKPIRAEYLSAGWVHFSRD